MDIVFFCIIKLDKLASFIAVCQKSALDDFLLNTYSNSFATNIKIDI